VLVTRASEVLITGLRQWATRPTYGSGVYIDATTTHDVVVSSPRRRAVRGG
jgi:hypothetical protein